MDNDFFPMDLSAPEPRDADEAWLFVIHDQQLCVDTDQAPAPGLPRAPSFLLLRRDPRLEAVPPRRAAAAHDARASRALLRVRARASIPSRRRRQ